MSEHTLLLGYDLGNEKTQLAVFDSQTKEPKLVGQTQENPYAMYDTAILLDDQMPMTGFVDRIQKGQEILIDGKVADPVKILAYYFRKTLMATRQQYPSETILQLVVTVKEATPEFVQILYDALDLLGIGKDRACVLGHKQTFLYYMMAQKKELWVNDVGVFDYDGNGLRYYQMQVDRRKKPMPVRVDEKNFDEAVRTIQQDPTTQAVVLENVVYRGIHKQILSSLYMTGSGFQGEWSDELMRKLCVGRRLFQGDNLYVSGACYAARELSQKEGEKEYLILDDDCVMNQWMTTFYTDAKEQEVVIVQPGVPWYQVDEEIEVIPDGDTELDLKVCDIFTKEVRQFMIGMDPVIGKKDRHCRLKIRFRFKDANTCIVTVKDEGFGEFFPTSNRIWEKTISLR